MKIKSLVALSTIIVMTTVSTAFADNSIAENIENSDINSISKNEQELSSIINNYSDSFGGLYFDQETNTYHVIPYANAVNTYDLDNGMNKVDDIDLDIVYDTPAKYSYKELQDASDELGTEEVMSDLDITSVGVDVIGNGLFVGADEWTEDKKQAVRDATEIENITFEIFSGIPAEENEENSNEAETLSTRINFASEARYGSYLFHSNGGSSSLGGMVSYDNDDDSLLFITSAHGTSNGNNISVELSTGPDTVGEIVDLKMGGSVDAALIEVENPYLQVLSYSVNLEGEAPEEFPVIMASGAPIVGKISRIYGRNSQVFVTIEDVDRNIYWNDTDNDDTGYYTNMIKMSPLGGQTTQSGDSGAGVIMLDYSNDGYISFGTVSGIYKGRSSDGALIASRWDSVVEEFGVGFKFVD